MTAIEAREKFKRYGYLASVRFRIECAEKEFKARLIDIYNDDELLVIFAEYVFERR